MKNFTKTGANRIKMRINVHKCKDLWLIHANRCVIWTATDDVCTAMHIIVSVYKGVIIKKCLHTLIHFIQQHFPHNSVLYYVSTSGSKVRYTGLLVVGPETNWQIRVNKWERHRCVDMYNLAMLKPLCKYHI